MKIKTKIQASRKKKKEIKIKKIGKKKTKRTQKVIEAPAIALRRVVSVDHGLGYQ